MFGSWRSLRAAGFAALVLLAGALTASAQSFVLDLPRESPAATVSQRIGLTDMEVTYSRPLVKSRKIWGGLVPYDQVWRAGANHNTTLMVSDAFTFAGQAVPAGTYGVHMIPGKETWTVILSKESGVWGSYTYDQKEDAVRVNVKPIEAPMHEALVYSFDEIKENGATLTLAWEKLAVPVAIGLDANAITKAKVERQLRDLPKWTWESWNDAANWALSTKAYNEDALKWADESIKLEERFDNLDTKAQVLTAMGKPAEAQAVMAKALPKANTLQRHQYARRLLNEKKVDEALVIFRDNVKKNPDTWYVYGGLARGLSAKGDYKTAAAQMSEALKRAPADVKPQLQGMLERLQKGEDINS